MTKDLLYTLGFAVVLCSHIVMMWTFLIAYSSGYSVTIYINNYNEALLELILIIITAPLVIYTTLRILKLNRETFK